MARSARIWPILSSGGGLCRRREVRTRSKRIVARGKPIKCRKGAKRRPRGIWREPFELQEDHFEACGALGSDLGPPGVLQRAPRDPLGSARRALGELLGRSGSVLGRFGSTFGSILGEKIELCSGSVAFSRIELPSTREHRF